MSHFSKIKTRISNKKYLIQALRQMNYDIEENSKCVGYNGNKIDADIVIKLPETNYNIAFIKSDNSYDLVADWYGLKGLDSKNIVSKIEENITIIENKIKQQYAYNSTVESLKEKGFSIDEEIRENGEIRIKLSRIV